MNKEEMMKLEHMDVIAYINKHMTTAIMFHSQMADYFAFIGLHGFKRMHEYRYYDEGIGRRKFHKKIMELHNKLIPITGHDKVSVIPNDWYKYTRMDIDDNVISKFTRHAMMAYKDWEEKTKELYETACEVMMEHGWISDYMIMKTYVADVQEELKHIYRTCEELNLVGYDVLHIVEMQKNIHDKYKEKMRSLRG